MKNKLSIALIAIVVMLALALIVFVTLKNEINNNPSNDSRELIVQNIKDKVTLIDRGKNYETKILNNEEFIGHMTDGGGQLVGYFENGALRKIEEKLGLSYGVITYGYYFYEGNLILIHELEEDFPYSEDTGSLDYSRVEFAFSGYYYIENDNLVDY